MKNFQNVSQPSWVEMSIRESLKNRPFDFPKNEYPELLKAMIEAVESKTNAPTSLIGTIILSITSEATQMHHVLHAPDESPSYPTVWSLPAAESGKGKTPATDMLRKPLVEFEEKRRHEYNQAKRRHEIDLQSWNVKHKVLQSLYNKAIKKKNGENEARDEFEKHTREMPTEPRLIKLTYNNTTIEALCHELNKNSSSAALVYDEGSTFLKSRMIDSLGTINKLWEKGPLSISRRSHNEELYISDPRLSITLGVQPAALEHYQNRRGTEARDLGLFSRFLVCKPRKGRWDEIIEWSETQESAANCYNERMTELLNEGMEFIDDSSKKKKIVTFSSEAAQLFIECRRIIRDEMENNNSILKKIPDFSSKMSRHIARVATNFELIQTGNLIVSHDMIQRAINVIIWYAHEYYHTLTPPPDVPQRINDAPLMHDKLIELSNYYSTRYLPKSLAQRHAPGALRNGGRHNAALELLHESNRIRVFDYMGISLIDMNPTYDINPQAAQAVVDEYRRYRKYDFSVKELRLQI